MRPSSLVQSSRLMQLRDSLKDQEVDLQRVYNFSMWSTKLFIRKVALRIVAVDHPYLNYENTGEWRGYIQAVTKPSEINITFLEDDSHIVNGLLGMWDLLKYNHSTGIHYPKAVYEDQGELHYHGPKFSTGKASTNLEQKYEIKTRSYTLLGLYPIGRQPHSLSYDSNDVLRMTVPFNVDAIVPNHVMGVGK